jgi:nucleoside-diphosphate-sugar epimerase
MARVSEKSLYKRSRGIKLATRVLIIGASGFIGRNILNIESENSYIALKEVDLLQRDSVTKVLEAAQKNRCELILSLAWKSNSQNTYEVGEEHDHWANTTFELAKACIDNQIHFVGVGSCLDNQVNPVSNYEIGKQRVRNRILKELSDKEWTWVRPFWIYSKSGSHPRLLREFLNCDSESFNLRSGSSKRDFIDILDVATAFDVICKFKPSGVVDVGSGFLTSNLSLLMKMRQLNPGKTIIDLAIPEVDGVTSDNRAMGNLGWNPIESRSLLL